LRWLVGLGIAAACGGCVGYWQHTSKSSTGSLVTDIAVVNRSLAVESCAIDAEVRHVIAWFVVPYGGAGGVDSETDPRRALTIGRCGATLATLPAQVFPPDVPRAPPPWCTATVARWRAAGPDRRLWDETSESCRRWLGPAPGSAR